jgi:hypothetical protein
LKSGVSKIQPNFLTLSWTFGLKMKKPSTPRLDWPKGLLSRRRYWMNAKKITRNILKAGVLMGTAGLMMGNQSCQEQPTASRELKRIVEMKKIISPAIELPQGQSFDFEYVANQQVYAVLQKSEHFALRYMPPVVTVPTAFSADTKSLKVSPNDTMMLKAFAANAGISEKPQYSKEAECMINLPNANIAGSVNSFEIIGGLGVKIGFDPTGAHQTSGLTGAGFQAQWAQLDLSLMAVNPLSQGLLAGVNVNAKQTKTAVNFSFLFGGFAVGPSAYYSTPLAKVTQTALIRGVEGLYQQLKTKQEWYSRVLVNHDTHMAILGGTNVNMKVGDQLNIYNEEYYWEGEPCAKDSKYYGGGAKTPVATIEIDWVGDEVSRGRVIQQGDENAVLGAKVKILKLASDVPPAPKK